MNATMNTETSRVEQIKQRLTQTLNPSSLDIIDESHKHVGHAGAREGGGHFIVNITADTFNGKGMLQRHRLVYDALDDMMNKEIHALSIKAMSPDETNN